MTDAKEEVWLRRIASKFVGVNYGHLTTLERQICIDLQQAGWLGLDKHNDIVKVR